MNTYIKTVRATGLKSGDFSYNLTALTVITGPSGKGKTSVMDAIRLALKGGTLLGRASELKERTIDIMELARNGQIEVSCTDSIGRENIRAWVRGKNCGNLKVEIPETPDVLLDCGQYLLLSDAKKIEYAFRCYSIADMADFSGLFVSAAVRNIKLEHNTTESEAALAALVNRISNSEQGREEIGENVQEWLDKTITTLKSDLSRADANADRMTKTVQGLTLLSPDSDVLRNPESELATTRRRAAEIMTQRGDIERDLKRVLELRERFKAIDAEIAGLTDKPEEILALDKEIEEASKAIGDLEGAPLPMPLEFENLDEAKLRQELEALNQSIVAYRSKTSAFVNDKVNFYNVLNNRERDLARHNHETTLLVTRHQAAMAISSCETCGALSEYWSGSYSKAARAVAHEKSMADRAVEAARLQKLIDEAKEAYRVAEAGHAESVGADTAVESKKAQANQIMARLNRFGQAKMAAQAARIQSIRVQRSAFDSARNRRMQLGSIGDARAAANARRSEVQGELEKLPSAEALTQNFQSTLNDLRAVEADIVTLEEKRVAYIQAKAHETRNAQALIEHRKATAEVEITKAALKVVSDIRAKMVAVAFGEILRTVNAITAGVIAEPIEYREGEIGRWRGATWIKHESFSGYEKALTYAGISLALAKGAPIRLVLLDEMGRMDPDTKTRVVIRMMELIGAGVLDQFIGCDSSPFTMEGVQTIAIL